MDVANGVTNFQRTILSAQVQRVGQNLAREGWQEPFQLCQFEVTGQAFRLSSSPLYDGYSFSNWPRNGEARG